MKLTEGMRGGDLEDLLLPLISIDEFESKVDDNAVVIGFYVNDHDAANDLNRFIQKSPVAILDTEVSPAPDQRGYYLVFVEFLNNQRMGENIATVVDEVSPLANIENWQARIRGVERLVAFSEEAVKSHFTESKEKNVSEAAQNVMAFLQPSAIESVIASTERLIFEGFGYRDEYEIIAFGALDKILAEQELSIQPQDVGISAAVDANKMDRRLGEGWTVSTLSGMKLISHYESDEVLLVKPI